MQNPPSVRRVKKPASDKGRAEMFLFPCCCNRLKIITVFAFLIFLGNTWAESVSAPKRPNLVIIFTDDQGYADLSCFGGRHVSTPRIDQMAQEGSRLTSFYVAAPVCTPSRAGLMTGCYPKRIDMATGSNYGVLLAGDKKGLNPEEITIAEVLRGAGYKTGMFGKWHLGDQLDFLPTKQGFDEFFGLHTAMTSIHFTRIRKNTNFHLFLYWRGRRLSKWTRMLTI